jgi:hypothetical protein
MQCTTYTVHSAYVSALDVRQASQYVIGLIVIGSIQTIKNRSIPHQHSNS